MTQVINRNSFFERVQKCGLRDSLPDIQVAYWLAKEGHRVQAPRDSGERYFEHPREVAWLLLDYGYNSRKAIVLGLTHDVVEDTYALREVIVRLLGQETFEELCLLSKQIPIFDPANGRLLDYNVKTKPEYYGAIARGPLEVKVTKGVDRICNLSSMGTAWPIDRQKKKAEETREFILPFMWDTDKRIAEELDRLVTNILAQ
jgi:(p)ppGpp synthase/HD superfamily hydrolase